MCHLYPEERSVNNSIRVAAEVAAEMGFDQSAKMVPMGISDAGKNRTWSRHLFDCESSLASIFQAIGSLFEQADPSQFT